MHDMQQPDEQDFAPFLASPYAGKLKVINLWAGPGAGKSTTAAGLFNLMKRERFEVELVGEVAKDYTWEKSTRLSNQLLILAEQEHRVRRLIGQCEYAIVDSPFPLGTLYTSELWEARLLPIIDKLWDDYENYDFLLQRSRKPFQKFGRNQTFEQAVEIDGRVQNLFLDFALGNAWEVDADDPTVEYQMLDYVLKAQGLPSAIINEG